MSDVISGPSLAGVPIHLTGIKGTGMTALAELLHARGAVLSGSDTHEKFYTDEILKRLGIDFREDFAAANLPPNARLVVYSAAYSPQENPELLEAQRLGIPVLAYPEVLGLLSQLSDSSAVAGVHGKTTTTAMIGTVLKHLGFPASVLVGSAVSTFGDSSTMVGGDAYFIAETCEYRRHFLSFQPRRIVVTSVEADHLDYFSGYDDVLEAFSSFARKIPDDGALIFCADDPGAAEVAYRMTGSLPATIGYGRTASGRFGIPEVRQLPGETRFRLTGVPARWFTLKVPGLHSVLNAAATIALTVLLLEDRNGVPPTEAEYDLIAAGIADFAGSRRRSEIVGERGGVLFLDDYGHHPTAIRATLSGLRAFYPGRRIVLDFMSHTYSRTSAFIEDFARSFADADVVILHKIYASAREKKANVSGYDLYERTANHHPDVHYFEEPEDALPFCEENLLPGDLFVTMGAGSNWTLGRRLFRLFAAAEDRAAGRAGSRA